MRLKLVSWNVNGIRAVVKKGFWDNLKTINPDIWSLQETKSDGEIMDKLYGKHHPDKDNKSGLFTSDIDLETEQIDDFGILWHSSTMRKGYSGVATFWKHHKVSITEYKIGIGDPTYDVEGRLVETQICSRDGQYLFTLINAYYPQGGRGPHRIEYKIGFYQQVKLRTQELKKQGKKVVLCGDFNTTVSDIDLARAKENRKTTGCLPQERDALDWFIKDGFIDSFRHFYPDMPDRYSYWDQITRARERNVGWRIDYFLVDKDLENNLKSADIHDQIMGSDHCPVSIELEF
jgi:exodeoxyribonuclease III